MQELPEGYTYRAWHKRVYPEDSLNGFDPLPHGGSTVVKVGYVLDHKTEDGVEKEFVVLAEGEARCSPRDQYSKKRGRDIALGRALKKVQQR